MRLIGMKRHGGIVHTGGMIMRFPLILGIVVLLATVLCAAEDVQPAGGTISLDFNDTDLSQAFSTIAQKTQNTILVDPAVKGKVSLSLTSVTAEQALNTICKLNKLVLLKVYLPAATEGEKPTASKLIALVDAIKALGGKSLIWEDPATQTQGVFVPDAKPDAIAVPSLAASLNLKPVYLVRTESAPKPEQESTQPKVVQSIAVMAPPGDPRAAAQELWSYFSQIPFEQRRDVMRELGRMMFESLTPEQREAMRPRWGDRGDRRGPREGRPEMPPGPGPAPMPPGQ